MEWNGQFEGESVGIVSSSECFCSLPLVLSRGKKEVALVKIISPVVSEGEPLA